MSKKLDNNITEFKTQDKEKEQEQGGVYFSEQETLKAIAKGHYVQEKADHLLDKINALRFRLQEEKVNPIVEDEDGAYIQIDFVEQELKKIESLAAGVKGLITPESELDRIIFADKQ